MSVEELDRSRSLDLPPRQPLAGRTCLVTGGSRGIGRGVARELGRYGATVLVNYRSSEAEANAVADAISDADTEGSGHPMQADVTDRDDVSLHGAFNCTKAFYDDVEAAENGRIVNVSSVVGKQGNVGQANHAAAKSGLFGFTRSLALELAGTGTTANCIAPGFTRTEMVASIPDHIQDDLREDIPLERFAIVEEIAGLVRYLAAEASGYVTGEVIDVNGGIDR